MRQCRIKGFSYELGEQTHEYTSASGYSEVLEREKIPDMPEMWGWGRFYVTTQPYALACGVAREALKRASVDPADVDLTVLSCSYFPDSDEELYRGATMMLRELGLVRSVLDGQTLAGCATLLSSLQRAAQLVEAGLHENVLVVALDCLPNNEHRFWNYALFSDAAVAFVVSSQLDDFGCRLRASHRECNLDEMGGDVRFDGKSQLHVKVLDSLWERLQGEGVTREGVKKVFNNNVFLPIKSQKDKLASVSREQRFTDNVARTGHCLSCDSVINFVDYCAGCSLSVGDQFVLQADGNGICAAVLLEWAAPIQGEQ